MATRTGLSAHIPVNCGVPVGPQCKEWKSFHQRVLLAMIRHEVIKFNSVESTVRYLGIESTTLSPKPTG